MQLLPRRLPALFSCGLLLLEAACLAAAATAFVVAPPAAGPALPPPQRGTVLMMAQRHYVKHTRADFLLKSALATGAFVPVVMGLRKDGAVTPAAQQPRDIAPLQRDAHDDDDQKLESSSSSFGPPLRFEKEQGAAMREMREVIDRFGGSVWREGRDLIRVDFGGAQELELRFTKDGNVHTRVGRECRDMRQVNLLGEELAAKGGWHVTGYPLCLDPVMAKYI